MAAGREPGAGSYAGAVSAPSTPVPSGVTAAAGRGQVGWRRLVDLLARLLRPVLLLNVAAQVGIVVTGGLVRLTGSGLGCPTWPQCVPGSYVPTVRQAQGWHKDVEFGNRLLTFVVGAAAVAAVVVVTAWVVRTGAPRRLLAFAAVPILGVMAQAVLGGITVLTNLAPAAVAAHFLLSMVLVAASVVLLLALTRPEPPRRTARRSGCSPGPSRSWPPWSWASAPWSPARARTRATPSTRPGSASTLDP